MHDKVSHISALYYIRNIVTCLVCCM